MTKKAINSVKAEKAVKQTKAKVGRPRKQKTTAEEPKKVKLTLAEKQEIKLKEQKKKEAEKRAQGEPKNKDRFYCTNKELQAELIKWRDSNKIVEQRSMSEELAKMLLAIGNKLLNHSNFRNYDKETKEDMLMFGIEKIIKGLKNYNFKFTNPFAWMTQAFWNAYLSILNRKYKQINIKKDLMKKLAMELETYTGVSSNQGLSRCIKSYLGNDVEVD